MFHSRSDHPHHEGTPESDFGTAQDFERQFCAELLEVSRSIKVVVQIIENHSPTGGRSPVSAGKGPRSGRTGSGFPGRSSHPPRNQKSRCAHAKAKLPPDAPGVAERSTEVESLMKTEIAVPAQVRALLKP